MTSLITTVFLSPTRTYFLRDVTRQFPALQPMQPMQVYTSQNHYQNLAPTNQSYLQDCTMLFVSRASLLMTSSKSSLPQSLPPNGTKTGWMLLKSYLVRLPQTGRPLPAVSPTDPVLPYSLKELQVKMLFLTRIKSGQVLRASRLVSLPHTR